MGERRQLRFLQSFSKLHQKGRRYTATFSHTFKYLAKAGALILFYYTFSIGLTFFNQRFVKLYKLPLSVTIIHLLIKFTLASWVRTGYECYREEDRVMLPWGAYMKRVSLAGICTGLDIGLSNWSFEFITVSLYTMTKSSAVLFILMFSLLFKLEKMSWWLMAIVSLIATGLFLFTYQSTQFEWHGFILVLSAAVISGLRWTLSQLILQKKEIGLSHPIDMMYHMQPWMLVGLIPLATVVEGLYVSRSKYAFHYGDISMALTTFGLAMAGAMQAFFLELGEFLLLYHTSCLTLSIVGILKEICTLYFAYEFNGDRMSLLNGIGLAVCLGGITLHVIIKTKKNHKPEQHIEHAQLESMESMESMQMLTQDGDANDDGGDELFDAIDAQR